MLHLSSCGKPTQWLFLGLIVTVTTIPPVLAHQVEVAADVGGTLHIEPNDQPLAGKAALTKIILTRKGGEAVPLAQCDCELAVYAKPDTKNSPPLLQPPLKPVSAEGYKGIPGAEITFPQPGAYQLVLRGTPKAGAKFQPFQLNYDVTVAAGVTGLTEQTNTQTPRQLSGGWRTEVVALSTLLGLGMILLVWRRWQGKRH